MSPQATVFIVKGEEKRGNSLHWLEELAEWDINAYSSAEAFLDVFDPALPGCLLLDAHAPKMGGLLLQKQLRSQHSRLPIIFVSTHGTVAEAVQALHAGATDFLMPPFKKSLLLRRLKESIERDKKVREAQKKKAEITARLKQLTAREQEVMKRVIEGKLNKMIASELDISIKTVEVHRARVMRKLHVRSQADLIRLITQCSHKQGYCASLSTRIPQQAL